MYSNKSLLHSIAFSILRARSITALPQDKGGGFVLVCTEDLRKMRTSILGDGSVYNSGVVVSISHTRKAVLKLCSNVEHVTGERGLATELGKPVWRGDSLFAKLQMTVKVHKAQGLQTARAIHAMPSYMAEGISRWVAPCTLR